MGSGGRLFPRPFTRCLKESASSWIVFIFLIFITYSISAFIIQTIGQDHHPKRPRSTPDFADAFDQFDLHRTLLKRIWPPLRGYPHQSVKENTNPNDTLLLHRIELTQRNIRTPLFKVKNRVGSNQSGDLYRVKERHPWKFEKIIHQTWKTEDIPGQTAQWVAKWLEIHPDWTYIFWTDENSREFIREYYPPLLPVLDSWTVPVQKADMIRLLILYTFGGVYADLDIEPLKPLNEIQEWGSCVLSREPDLQTYVMVNDLNVWANNWTFTCNAFMACRSHHPFLHYLISRIALRSPLVTGRSCHLEETILCTGPLFVSLGYGYYTRSITEDIRLLRPETDVMCPHYGYFLPTFDGSRMELLRKNCEKFVNNKQKEVCDEWKSRDFKNEPFDYSFTDHHWFHSYHFNVSRTQVNIHDVTSALIWSKSTENEHFEVTHTGL